MAVSPSRQDLDVDHSRVQAEEATDFAIRLRAAIAEANVPTLQMLCVQLSGDQAWLEAPYRPTPSRGVDENDSGGLPVEVQDQLRSAAYEAILQWHGGRPIAIPRLSPDELIRMMSVSTGETIPDAYGPMSRCSSCGRT